MNENYFSTSSMVAGIGLSFVSERKKQHVNLLLQYEVILKKSNANVVLLFRPFLKSNCLPGRMNVMRPEVMAMEPKMRVGMIGLISARAATVVDKVPPT